MVGDPVGKVGTDIGDAEHVDEKLAEFEESWCHFVDRVAEPGVAGSGGNGRMLVADRSDTRTRGGDDRVVSGEDVDELSDTANGLVGVAGVGEHLPTACLLDRELDSDTEAFEQQHGGAWGVRPHRVVEAGCEQCDSHRLSFSVLLWCIAHRRG